MLATDLEWRRLNRTTCTKVGAEGGWDNGEEPAKPRTGPLGPGCSVSPPGKG